MHPALSWLKLLLLAGLAVCAVLMHAQAHAVMDTSEVEAVVEEALVEEVISDIVEGDAVTEDPDLDVLAPRATAPTWEDQWDEQHPLPPSGSRPTAPRSTLPCGARCEAASPWLTVLLRPPQARQH
ncbi:MAG: hypothetical protein ACK4MG_11080 [Aquabacterium sp.]